MTKNTFEVLKKLQVVNQAAVLEIDRVRKKAEKYSDFEDDYWNASETEQQMKVLRIMLLSIFTFRFWTKHSRVETPNKISKTNIY